MISLREALEQVRTNKRNFGTEYLYFTEAQGRILAEDVYADRDFPPFDRVAMDGIAINFSAFEQGIVSFKIENIQAAGEPRKVLQAKANCMEVMTGAILPGNTDTVIPYEEFRIENGHALIEAESGKLKKYRNVHQQGTDSRQGSVLLKKGLKIKSAHIGILASAGIQEVPVLKAPSVAICSTGDELVDVDKKPELHQLRKSNVYMLLAALRKQGISADLFHFKDDKSTLLEGIGDLRKKYDVLLFSGAVSRGKFDYLPEVLDALGLTTIFHRVAQKPGKPVLFGAFENGPFVFGFPGNPVSTFVCYHLFFLEWLNSSYGSENRAVPVRLNSQVVFKPQLSYHLLVSVASGDSVGEASPVIGSGSGDLPGLAYADGFITLPAEREVFDEGELFNFKEFE